jgi:DNA replicative helicase MCM subunit Mcm2 (Cdc46/Mcm family)
MDLVYVFTDDDDDDEAVADAIMGQFAGEESESNTPLSPEDLRKYLHYTLTEYNPEVPQEAREYAAEVWKDLRDQTDGAIDKRDAKSILRLAIASARLHRRDAVTIADVEAAQELKIESLEQVGNGEIDSTVKYSGELTEQSQVKKAVLETVDEDGIEEEDLTEKLVVDGHAEDTVTYYVEKHLNSGEITRGDGGVLKTV